MNAVAGAIAGATIGIIVSSIDPCTGKVKFQGLANLVINVTAGAAFGALAMSVSASTAMGLGTGVGIGSLSSLVNFVLAEPCGKEPDECP